MGWALIGDVFDTFAFAICLALHQHSNPAFKCFDPLGLVGDNIGKFVIHLGGMRKGCFQIH
jgi:hypothetical protein